jgi:ADP-ribose pyrophosphatase YjhB (NUDIX family)
MKGELPRFNVIGLAVIFDTARKKILIGRRENDPYVPKLTWCFPGDTANHSEDIDKSLKRAVKEQTGYIVKNLGAIFSKTYPEKKDLLSVYFFCEYIEGKEKVGGNLKELKWVSPREIGKYFTTSFHPKLKEYIDNLA